MEAGPDHSVEAIGVCVELHSGSLRQTASPAVLCILDNKSPKMMDYVAQNSSGRKVWKDPSMESSRRPAREHFLKKSVCPSFLLCRRWQNPQFARILSSGLEAQIASSATELSSGTSSYQPLARESASAIAI